MNWNYGLCWLAIIWGAIIAVLTVLAFIQECGLRRTAVVGGWCGLVCLGLVTAGALLLLAVGVL